MRIQIVSDLHLDYFPLWQRVLEDSVIQYSKDVDLLIVAGDHAEAHDPLWLESFEMLSKAYAQVIVVLGNHDHYNCRHKDLKLIINRLPENVKVLDKETIKVGDLTFAGATLWFRKLYYGHERENLEDFFAIEGGEAWLLKENYEDQKFFESVKADVFISHHLPSYQSVAKRFIGTRLNCFFVCCMEDLIIEEQPRLWIHGHTHDPCDYYINKTRVICNPRGGRGDVHKYSPKIIEL